MKYSKFIGAKIGKNRFGWLEMIEMFNEFYLLEWILVSILTRFKSI